jgi:hypothetical protein
MGRWLIAAAIAVVLGAIGYGIAALVSDDSSAAIITGAICFALGFALAAMATITSSTDERPSAKRRSS